MPPFSQQVYATLDLSPWQQQTLMGIEASLSRIADALDRLAEQKAYTDAKVPNRISGGGSVHHE